MTLEIIIAISMAINIRLFEFKKTLGSKILNFLTDNKTPCLSFLIIYKPPLIAYILIFLLSPKEYCIYPTSLELPQKLIKNYPR